MDHMMYLHSLLAVFVQEFSANIADSFLDTAHVLHS